MPTLVITKPDGSTEEHAFDDEITVGRETSNGIVLRDLSVSRRHARFFVEDGKPVVEDLGSSNGVLVEGTPIDQPTAIAAGLEIRIGDFVFNLKGEARRPTRSGAGRPKAGGDDGGAPPRRGVTKNGAGARSNSLARAGGEGSKSVARRSGPGGPRSGNLAPRGASRPGIQSAAKGSAKLRGMAGPWAGEVFPLSKPAVIVGRMAPADVVVDDDSVSRRHAELRRSGPGYTVRDLGSANGTYIEDERCAGERPLRPGDVVKFGVVEFTYDGPPAAKKAADSATSKRKKILIGLLGIAIFMVVLGIVYKQRNTPPPDDLGMKPVTDPTDEIRNRDEKIFESMQRGKAFVRDEQWDQAIKELTAVLDEDPVNREAAKLQKKAQRELEMKRLFDEAKKKIDVGQEQEGLQKYLQIEQESAYYRRARIEVQGIAKRLSIKYRGDCKGYVQARQFEKGAEACSRYLDFNCHAGTDVEALRFLQTAEKQVKSKTYKRWTCPAELTPWLVDKKDAGTADIATELTAIYVDQDIVNALVLYAKDNKILDAVEALRKIRKNPSKAKQHQRCDELIQRLNTVYGKYTDGQGAFMGNDLKKADANWRVAWDIDQAIMPRSIKSATNRNIGQNMADGYYKVGKALYDQGRFVDAFLTWDKGFAYRPDHPNTLSGFQLLETQARTELDAAPNCTKLSEILKYTRETPTKSPAHETAEKMRVEQKCGG